MKIYLSILIKYPLNFSLMFIEPATFNNVFLTFEGSDYIDIEGL